MRKISGLLFTLLALFLICCNPDRNTDPNTATPTNNSGDTGKRVQDIRAKKKLPAPGLTPEPYELRFDEPTFITVVTNSAQPQKVWMVYYDQKDWVEKPLGEGSGENNHVIGGLTFQEPHGIYTRSEDWPEFYMGYSVDEGRNWLNHKIARTSLQCIEGKGRQIKQKQAHLLVSLPLNPKNNLPDVAIVLQWNKFRQPPGNKGELSGVDLTKLCSALKDLPLPSSETPQQ